MSEKTKSPNFETAANKFDHGLQLARQADQMEELSPAAASKLREASTALIKEAREAKAGK